MRITRAMTLAITLSTAGIGVVAQDASGADTRKGSVRHSSRSASGRTTTKTTTRTTTTRTRPANRRAAPPATRRTATRTGARRGYRAGYSRGRYHGWHDARRDWYRWRTVTGLLKLGVYAATRPKQTTTVVVTGSTYYYAGGVYYQASGSGYVVVAPPPGAVVYSVPSYATVVQAGGTEYVYVNGTYYVPTTKPAEVPPPAPDPSVAEVTATQAEGDDPSDIPMMEADDENFEVVAPPPGVTVPYLPDDAEEDTVQGKKYYVYSGTYYRPYASDGDTIYMVVSDPHEETA